jgi:hypothetical protein
VDEPKKWRNFNILVLNPSANSVISYFTTTEKDLLQELKNARFAEDKWVVWDKGVLRTDAIIGIIEN